MARLRSASECSLESVESDSDGGFKPGQSGAECSSDTESDIEMEVSIKLYIYLLSIISKHIMTLCTRVT